MTEATSAAHDRPIVSRWRRASRSAATTPAGGFTDTAELERWMIEWISAKLVVPITSIARDQPVADYGVDSLTAISLAGQLEQALGRPISPSIAWEFPTIAEIAVHLMSGGGGETADMDAA